MTHFECRGQGWQHFVSEGWGECRRLVEVADDQLASRQIDVYDGGQVLVYDRRHARDRYGMLIGRRFSRKPKWKKGFSGLRLLSAAEFDAAWRAMATKAVQRAD